MSISENYSNVKLLTLEPLTSAHCESDMNSDNRQGACNQSELPQHPSLPHVRLLQTHTKDRSVYTQSDFNLVGQLPTNPWNNLIASEFCSTYTVKTQGNELEIDFKHWTKSFVSSQQGKYWHKVKWRGVPRKWAINYFFLHYNKNLLTFPNLIYSYLKKKKQTLKVLSADVILEFQCDPLQGIWDIRQM